MTTLADTPGQAVRLRFTKMHGAGNDFVVLDGVRQTVRLTPAQYRWLAHRHFGIGADQVLLVEPPDGAGIDFVYRIFNADGGEVEHCGNGARCFAVFVHEQGLSERTTLRVRTARGVIVPQRMDDGRVRVDMGPPVFDEEALPFSPTGLPVQTQGAARIWTLPITATDGVTRPFSFQAVSMGNPHAVHWMAAGTTDWSGPPDGGAPVRDWVQATGLAVATHPRFARGVNAGYVQAVGRGQMQLRVFERGVGETLACGTGACAAAVSGIQRGLLDSRVDVQALGGRLTIEWQGHGDAGAAAPVLMTGPAVSLFHSEIEVPANPEC